MLFKDQRLNCTSESIEKENIKKLADAVLGLKTNPNSLRELLLDGLEMKEQSHNPDHSFCEYKNSDNKRITEKRICRCMYYYNKPRASQKQIEKCLKCTYPAKLRNHSDYEILDYEVPMEIVTKGVGGIDLLIKDRISGDIYGLELKPPFDSNNETIVRMVAEILTYLEILKITNKEAEKIKPAICFFEKNNILQPATDNSIQWKDYHKWLDYEDFQNMISAVTVFYISLSGDCFDIKMI